MGRLTLAIVAVASGLVVAGLAPPAAAQDSITVSSWGGAFQDAERKAFFEPAAKALKITIKEDTTNGIADVRAQVQARAVKWDVTEQGSNTCAQLQAEGNVEPLDYSVIKTEGIPKSLVSSHWVGIIFYSTVIAWNTAKYGDKGPQTWAEFWDVKKFPGRRSLYGKPYYNLEAATMADGVPKEKVYEVLSTEKGLNRAFEKLKEIKPHVAVWWKSGAQSAQLLKDGEVDLIGLWNGRVSTIMKDGAKANFTFNQGVFDYDCLVIPKGAKNKALAMKAINEFLKPENQAMLPRYISYGPVNQLAFDTGLISKADAAAITSAPNNAEKQTVFSATWYVGKIDKLTERFDAMLQQ
jgi:putative spermidine/putrescine transport system substrate-binding protein